MRYVFGPIHSRRLGQSLGIDPVPFKTCNWNCVYCQLGRTRPLTNVRREYIKRQDILAETELALAAHQLGEIDWVTFVGSGEPTLHSGLGWLIRQVKTLTTLPIAVITNGSLLYQPEVRRELGAADAVMPSLDAGNSRLYRKINRPWPRPTYKAYIQGLIDFRQEYTGRFWVEVMLVKGLNDTDEALHEIASVLKDVQPDQVHMLLPIRPPAENWVQADDETGLHRAQAILGEVARVVHPNVGQRVSYLTEDIETAILGIITRHPMPEEELCTALGRWSLVEIQQVLDKLQKSQTVKHVYRHSKRFWSAAGAYYPVEDSEYGVRKP